MIIRLLCAAALVVLVPAAASAQVSYVRAGKLVDPQAGKVLTDQLLCIEGERIVSVGPWKGAPKEGRVIDWSGLTVLPAQRKARAWDTYETTHARVTAALQDDFDSVFGRAFARAYERVMAEQKE